jgi:hypothetical protein
MFFDLLSVRIGLDVPGHATVEFADKPTRTRRVGGGKAYAREPRLEDSVKRTPMGKIAYRPGNLRRESKPHPCRQSMQYFAR